MSDYKTILYTTSEGVATLTLNRPEKRNAITAELTGEMIDALSIARDDGDVRAIVITGAGKGFCSGQDLSAFMTRPTPEEAEQMIINTYQPLIGLMTTLEKPIIGAINGVAAGAGASLALACDLRVMADNASIMQAFINIGLIPDAGATWLLAQQVGYSRAFEIAIEGERISADRCLALGLTNKVATTDDLMDEAVAWAKRLASRPTIGIGLTKTAMQYALLNNLHDTIGEEARLQKQTLVSHDHMEGVTAFLEKRAPEFTGK